jgi:ELWxxDGT repeat protein
LTVFQGRLYYTAVRDTGRRELWKLDGGAAGPMQVAQIGAATEAPGRFTVAGGRMYFAVYERLRGYSLWSSDGADAWRVKDFGHQRPAHLTAFAGGLVFATRDSLWRSDGTSEGTQPIAQVVILDADGRGPLAMLGERLVFAAYSDETGAEPWTSDGTPDGTYLLLDIAPGTESSYPVNFTPARDGLYFSATGGQNETVLWRADGTPEGTVSLASFSAPDYRPHLHSFVRLGAVYFLAGERLWRCQGDEVTLVEDEAIESLSLRSLHIVSDRMLLTADAAERGEALWTYAPRY